VEEYGSEEVDREVLRSNPENIEVSFHG